MKQTERLNQVTPVSKVLAAVVFIVLPFIAFWLGFNYQNNINAMYEACMQPLETPIIQAMPDAN